VSELSHSSASVRIQDVTRIASGAQLSPRIKDAGASTHGLPRRGHGSKLDFRAATPLARSATSANSQTRVGPNLQTVVLIDAGRRFLAHASFAQLASRERKQCASGGRLAFDASTRFQPKLRETGRARAHWRDTAADPLRGDDRGTNPCSVLLHV
jgi:hypothetical protein